MLFIHIGTQKTGSSSIQKVLAGSEDILHNRSFHYLRSGRDHFNKTRIHHNPIAAAIKGNGEEILNRPRSELDSCEHSTMIMSGELLSQVGMAQHLAKTVPERIRHETKIVLYLRRPDSYVESLYKQRIKNNDTGLSAEDFLSRQINNILHESVIDEYAEAFGSESIILKPYDRKILVNNDGVDDFFSTIGFEYLNELNRPENDANPSFSAAFSEVSGILVKNLSVDFPTITKAVQIAKPEGIYRSGDVFPISVRRAILQHHDEKIEELRQRFRPDLKVLFQTEDLTSGSKDPYPSPEEKVKLIKDAAAALVQAVPHIPRRMLSPRPRH